MMPGVIRVFPAIRGITSLALRKLCFVLGRVSLLPNTEEYRSDQSRIVGRLVPEEKFTAVRQYGSIDGIINRIGGKDDTIHVTLEMERRQVSGCYTTRAVAKELRHVLFEPVRLRGRGKWSRDGDGNWSLDDFKIESFEALSDAPLSQVLTELRSIPTEWTDESYDELGGIRHGPGISGMVVIDATMLLLLLRPGISG